LDDVSGKKLIFGLAGEDTFPKEHGGDDCIVGGNGDDGFTNSDEFVNYYVGGPGADVYHVDTAGNFVRIADFSGEDTISLKQTFFTFLVGNAGAPVNSAQLKSVPGYSTGTSAGAFEGTALIYDPSSGELWRDSDSGDNTTSATKVLTVLNKDGYVFDLADFVIE
jgi:hypothetical protein